MLVSNRLLIYNINAVFLSVRVFFFLDGTCSLSSFLFYKTVELFEILNHYKSIFTVQASYSAILGVA